MNSQDQDHPPTAPPLAAGPMVPPLPAEAYWQYLDDLDLSEEQKMALLQTLWAVMASFVELGFGVDPVQQLVPALVHGALENGGNPLHQDQARHGFNRAADSDAREGRHDGAND